MKNRFCVLIVIMTMTLLIGCESDDEVLKDTNVDVKEKYTEISQLNMTDEEIITSLIGDKSINEVETDEKNEEESEKNEVNNKDKKIGSDEGIEHEVVYVPLVFKGTTNAGSFYWHEYAYDEEGKKIKLTEYNEDSTIRSWSEYINDSDGKEIERIHFDADANITGSMTREYDDNGNLLKITYYNADKTIRGWHIFAVDAFGNEIEQISYDNAGNVQSRGTKEYDGSGNVIKEINYNSDGSIRNKKGYEYDIQGNIVKTEDYGDNDIDYPMSFEIYERGSRGEITKITRYTGNGMDILEWKEYFYEYVGECNSKQTVTNYNSEGIIEMISECNIDRYTENQSEIIKYSTTYTQYDIDGAMKNTWWEESIYVARVKK